MTTICVAVGVKPLFTCSSFMFNQPEIMTAAEELEVYSCVNSGEGRGTPVLFIRNAICRRLRGTESVLRVGTVTQHDTLLAHDNSTGSSSHPPGFTGAASIVWHGGVVCDGYHLQAPHRQAFDRRLHNRKKKREKGGNVCGSFNWPHKQTSENN